MSLCVFKCSNFDIHLKLFVSLQRICSEFETITEKALKVPENTEDMTQMVDYINFTKTKGITELNEKIKVNNLMMGSTCCILQNIHVLQKYIDFSYLITFLLSFTTTLCSDRKPTAD